MADFPPEYAHLVSDAIVAALPWIADCIVVRPSAGDFHIELRIEIPAVHPAIHEPLVIKTGHHSEGKWAPVLDLSWSIWNEDLVLTDADQTAHLAAIISSLKRFLQEESAGFQAWFEGRLTSGGTVVPADGEPFPVGQADKIIVRSWKGTFDRELVGSWPGWPNDPSDEFYKNLHSHQP